MGQRIVKQDNGLYAIWSTVVDGFLFEDGETILEFEPQSPFTYHDCNYNAQSIGVFQDRDTWNNRNTHESLVDAKEL